MSATRASLDRVSRLKSVDFPTLGRPTTATTGLPKTTEDVTLRDARA